MKTLRNPGDKEEIERRLHAVQLSSPRQWGKMSVHQMVCHVSDGFRMYMGEKPTELAPVPYPRKLTKWIALWAPTQWPKGFKTAPELDQLASGTTPVEFKTDMRELRKLIDHFSMLGGDFKWPAHPHFGRMSHTEWMRLAYLHTDHHLRQFGA